MTERDKSCAERIEPMLERTMAELKAALRLTDLQNEHDWLTLDNWKNDIIEARRGWTLNDTEARDLWDEMVWISENTEHGIDGWLEGILSIDKKTVYTVQMSWGGPSDEFEVKVDEGEVTGAAYLFRDWFDGARRELSGDDLEAVDRMMQYAGLGDFL